VDVLTVPATALQRGQDGLFVYVVNPDNTVGMQSVTVAAQTSGDPRVAVIERGLSAHDRVVVDGQYRLSPGARVIEAKAATAAGARP